MKKIVHKKVSYVLITPARDEADYIERTITSVISQTILPIKWIIVSDNSTDNTTEIVKKYAKEYHFIKLITINSSSTRDFSSKVKAFNTAYKHLKTLNYDFIGNLDADLSFPTDYYEILILKFIENEKLGIAGGTVYDILHGNPHKCLVNATSVRGGIQFFRRDCFKQIGGYIPLKIGGEDAVAEVTAKMKGWEVKTYSDIDVLHHRPTGTAQVNALKAKILRGKEYYLLGYDPFFMLIRTLYRTIERPFVLGSILMLVGYLSLYLRRSKMMVPHEFVRYLRSEQLKKLRKIIIHLRQ